MLEDYMATKGEEVVSSTREGGQNGEENNLEMEDDRNKDEIKKDDEEADLYNIKNFSV
jgi:hypothetical protein